MLGHLFLLWKCRCKQPDIGRVQLEVSSPETRLFPPPVQTHNQPAAAPTCSQMPAKIRLSKKAVDMTIQTELTKLNILAFYIFIISISIYFRDLSFENVPWILSGNVYLKRCIAVTEFSIFSRECFDTLHQTFCGCKMLILLPLQSRCQAWNFTSKSKRVC